MTFKSEDGSTVTVRKQDRSMIVEVDTCGDNGPILLVDSELVRPKSIKEKKVSAKDQIIALHLKGYSTKEIQAMNLFNPTTVWSVIVHYKPKQQ
jgi:hypothetical protein